MYYNFTHANTLSLGMVLLNPYNSSPSDCIIGAICNKNKHKNALLVNKTILPCLLGCSNCLGRCTSAYSCQAQHGGWPPHPFLQTAQAHNLCNTTTTACKQNTNQKQVKPAGKNPITKNMLKFVIYFKVFYFPPWEKSALQQMQANQSERMQSSGDNRYHCTKHIKQAKQIKQSQTIK